MKQREAIIRGNPEKVEQLFVFFFIIIIIIIIININIMWLLFNFIFYFEIKKKQKLWLLFHLYNKACTLLKYFNNQKKRNNKMKKNLLVILFVISCWQNNNNNDKNAWLIIEIGGLDSHPDFISTKDRNNFVQVPHLLTWLYE